MKELQDKPIPCMCGHDRTGLPRHTRCPECGSLELKPRHHDLYLTAKIGSRIVLALAAADCLLAVAVVLNHAILNPGVGSNETGITLTLGIWGYLILPAAGLSAVISIASMFHLDGYEDTLGRSFMALGMSCLGAIVPPITFAILAVIWSSI